MKMSTRAERGKIHVCKLLDSLRHMMYVALVFPTDITGRAIVAEVKGFLREVLTLSFFAVRSTKLLSEFTATSVV